MPANRVVRAAETTPEVAPHYAAHSEAPVPFRVLDQTGRSVEGRQVLMRPPEVLESLRWMYVSREFDAKATALQRQGRFGTFSSVSGQEATVVGAAMSVDPARDWLVP